MKYVEKCSGKKSRGCIIPKPSSLDQYYEADRVVYFSVFDHTDDIKYYKKINGSIKGYDGPVSIEDLLYDFDGPGALDDVRRFISQDPHNVRELDDYQVYFSGAKGFHLIIRTDQFITPSVRCAGAVKRWATFLRDEYQLWTMDLSVYKKLGIVRAPNSLHERTNLYKIPLYLGEVFVKNMDEILTLAKRKRRVVESEEIQNYLESLKTWTKHLH